MLRIKCFVEPYDLQCVISVVVCGNARVKAPQLSYHHFPSDHEKRALWLKVFQLTEEQFKPHHRVCSRHFRDGNPQKGPDVGLGKCFASPVNKGAPRTKRAKLKQQAKESHLFASNSLSALCTSESSSVPSGSPPPLTELPHSICWRAVTS